MTLYEFELSYTQELKDEWNDSPTQWLSWEAFVLYAYNRRQEHESN